MDYRHPRTGKTATAHLTVRAISVGTGNITVDTESTAGDPSSCKQKFCGPRLTLTAIAETPTPTPTPTPTAHVTPTPPAGSHQLAATGTSPWPLTWLGSALLATGAILTYQGRRRGKRT
jgi:LPXTG-motif cell wall-anchored protein